DTQGLKIQTFSFHSLKYYSQIFPLILLRYYDDVACVLRKMCLDAKAPHLSSTLSPTLSWKFNKHVQPNKELTRHGNGNSEELRCVIDVIRHGDRTPKQKVKLNFTEDKLLNLMLKYNGGKPRAEYYSQISHLILLRYYDDDACVLRKMCLDAKAPHLSSTLPPTLPWKFNKHAQPNKGQTRQGNENSEELCCVIAWRSNSKTEGETKCYRGKTVKPDAEVQWWKAKS
ncbi:hypothetical protein IGI04_006778, partial [Brassica rapa subsp. trilocularis]